MTIRCGWCDHATLPGLCSYCGRNPALPWLQRDTVPPEVIEQGAGRPALDVAEIRRKLAEARADLPDNHTQASLAAHLDISERTLSRWQKLSG